MSSWQFVKQFCREPRTIGAIAPSSNQLANRMIQQINFATARVIVEYGPGTGAFTRQVLKHINLNRTIFFGLELNEHMNRVACS
ncbi:MAG TPA: hypothetical protein DCG57_10760, partial [Candidatus Riflebacteria bacterium]|nr:hypothetical protein [Candidatus Riflebacteria bacterium]